MFIDHLGYFFPNTPLFFRWIGRISAPIFIFCAVNGIKYTHNKKLYLIRLYISGLLMSVFQYLTDQNLNFFRTLFSITLIIYILELYKKKEKKYMYIYIIYQLISCLLCSIVANSLYIPDYNFFIYIFPALLGNIFYLEGGLIYVSLGLVMYIFNDKPIKLSILYSAIGFINSLLMSLPIIPYFSLFMEKYFNSTGTIIAQNIEHLFHAYIGINMFAIGGNIFTEKCQWMIIFSLPLILLYNGKKGKNIKYFFYFFYPLHIIILWFISNIL